MKRAFRPEFLNRIDDIIVFHAVPAAHQEHHSPDDHAHQQT
jgi:ATP-dependent Clp protease ATP-binding subunit ClpA